MDSRSLLLGRSFGVVGALFVLACSGSAFTGKEGQQELETGGSSTTAGSGGAETTPNEGPGGAGKGGRTFTRGGTGGGGGNGNTSTVEPPIEGGSAPEAGGTGTTAGADVGGAGSTAGADIGGAGGVGGAGGTPPDPEPGCDSPVHDTWDAPLGASSGSGDWYVGFGDPHVDLTTHELLVSYDDVAVRSHELAGGYTMSAEVTMSGYTVLTPYPYVWEVIVPSLRRNAQGDGIELGGTSYGTGNAWRTDLFPGFGGVTISGTAKVRVTMYVQAESKKFATKVEAAGKAYRSGWVGNLTWKDTNLQILRFIGENNSSTYGGSSDILRVGPVDGCQKLSDASVLARYSE